MQTIVMFALLLAAGAQLRATAAASSDATAQLEAAARSNDVAAAKQAVKEGADLNAQGRGGQTPIMAATLAGSTDVVRCVTRLFLEVPVLLQCAMCSATVPLM
jgi:ankyrin repeat protein